MGSVKDHLRIQGVPFKDQIKEERETRRAVAYLHAFRNGFDKRYCSSPVKKFTRAEIEEYERNLKQK